MTGHARWLAHYDEGVPATLAPDPERTLLDCLDDLVRDRPEAAAVLFKGATLTWKALQRDSDALAVALAGLGAKRGDCIGLILPNCPQFLIVQFAIWKIG